MAVGLIFMIIALGGVLPTRLKIGEGEAEWQAVAGQVIETAVEASPPATRAELIDQLGTLAEVAPQAAAPALSGFAYEQLIEQILRARLPEIAGARALQRAITIQVSGRYWTVDFGIEATGNRLLLIEVKASPALTVANVMTVIERADSYQEKSPGYRIGLLLVTRHAFPGATLNLSVADRPVSFAVVRGPEDQDVLIGAINRSLAVLNELNRDSE